MRFGHGSSSWPRPAEALLASSYPCTSGRPSYSRMRRPAPHSLTTAREPPEPISCCSPLGAPTTSLLEDVLTTTVGQAPPCHAGLPDVMKTPGLVPDCGRSARRAHRPRPPAG